MQTLRGVHLKFKSNAYKKQCLFMLCPIYFECICISLAHASRETMDSAFSYLTLQYLLAVDRYIMLLLLLLPWGADVI